MIRKVAGESLGETFDGLLARTLGLNEMYLYGKATADRDRAHGYSGSETWGASEGKLVDCSSADDALPDSADGSVVSSARDLLRYHQMLRQGEILSSRSWRDMRTVQTRFYNGLGYLHWEGPVRSVRGQRGKSMGHVAANVYYPDLDIYVVIMSNRRDVPLPLQQLLHAWLAANHPSCSNPNSSADPTDIRRR